MAASNTPDFKLSAQNPNIALAQATAKDTKNTSIADDIASLTSTLSKLSIPLDDTKTATDPRFKKTDFLISNDDFAQEVNPVLTEMATTGKTQNAINVGIVIGESHFLSYTPELSQFLDVVIFFDSNPFFHDHSKQLITAMITAKDRGDFLNKYMSIRKRPFAQHPDFANHVATNVLLEEEMDQTGSDYFCFSSDERFTLCQESLKKLSIIHFRGDFFDLEMIKRFNAALTNPQLKTKNIIRLLNITNMSTYDEESKYLQPALDALTLQNARIIHSIPFPGRGNKCMAFVTNNPDVKAMKEEHRKLPEIEESIVSNMFKPSIKKSLFRIFLATNSNPLLSADQDGQTNPRPIFFNLLNDIMGSGGSDDYDDDISSDPHTSVVTADNTATAAVKPKT